MKKLALVLSLSLIAGLSACTSGGVTSGSESTNQSTSEPYLGYGNFICNQTRINGIGRFLGRYHPNL